MKIYEYIVRIKDQATDKLRRLTASSNQSAIGLRSLSSYASTASSNLFSLSGMAGLAARGLGPAVLAGALTFLGGQALSLASDLQQTQVGFEVMLGSAEKANKMITDLRQFAKVTPFETTDLVKATETMLGFGIAGEKVMPTIKMLGDVARGNAEKLRLITLAYSQIQAAGRLTGQDLLQLINAGFNPLQEISARTGKKLSVLKKEMEAGAISAGMVTDAFRSATSEGGRFFGMMEKQSQTFEGMASTLRDEWNEALTDLGFKILPYAIQSIKGLRSVLSDLTTRVDFSPLIMAFNSWFTAAKQVWDLLVQLWTSLGLSTTQVNLLQYAFNALAFSIQASTTPFRVIVNWIMFMIDLGKTAVATFKGFAEAIEGVFTFDVGKIKKGVATMLYAAGDGFEKMKGRVTDFISNEKKAYAAIFNTGPKPAGETPANPLANGGAGGVPPKPVVPPKDSTIDKINGGGRQAINVTINLNNLIGQQNFDVKNVKESVRDMEQQTIEALLRVLNSANYAAAQ